MTKRFPIKPARLIPMVLALGIILVVGVSYSATDIRGATISQTELMRNLQGNNEAVVIDVRYPGEFQKDHIPGAINIPYQQVEKAIPSLVTTNSNLVVYCETGYRSKIAQDTLKASGFKSVLRLDGDISHWRKAKLPLVEKRS